MEGSTQSLRLNNNDERMFDSIIWIDALKFDKIGVIGNQKILGKFIGLANDTFKHLHKDLSINFAESKIPPKKSLESNLIKTAGDFLNAKKQITNQFAKSKDIMFFIKNHIPFGSKTITVMQDDQNYIRENHYKKETKNLFNL